ncbi:MAG: hypothetical protein AAGC88_09725 [Bacteroidota bacterium]
MTGIKSISGRMDILITYPDNDFIMIMEVKTTDWDKIQPKNIKMNLWRHGRRLHNYIDKFRSKRISWTSYTISQRS